jgi:hypothetical protein
MIRTLRRKEAVMLTKSRLIVLGAGLTVAGIAVGATITSAVSSPVALTASTSKVKVPALQSGRYVFACVNPAGGIDYLEFRQPLPHQCWFAGEALWYWDAVPLAVASPTPTATPTPTPTFTPAKPVIANVETTALSYQAKGAAVVITSSLTLSDSDDLTISSATVSITSGFSSGIDMLPFTSASGSGITASYNATTGVLTLSGSASLATYQAALRSVEFSTNDPAGSPAARTVSFTVTDTLGATSNTAARTIDVTGA